MTGPDGGAAVPAANARAALVLDVDGVVSPVHGRTAWGDDASGYPGRSGEVGSVPVSPLLNNAIEQLAAMPGVVPVWLTSWDRGMREGMSFPGPGWEVVAHRYAHAGPPVFDEDAARQRAGERWDDNQWWKWWALDAWLRERPAIDTVVWCEDHLASPFFWFDDVEFAEDGPVLTQASVAAVDLERRGIRALLVAPATDVGLTPDDLRRASEVLDGRDLDPVERWTPPSEGPAPDAVQLGWLCHQRYARTCASCSAELWYLRHFEAGLIDCPVCGRTYYGGHDVTDRL